MYSYGKIDGPNYSHVLSCDGEEVFWYNVGDGVHRSSLDMHTLDTVIIEVEAVCKNLHMQLFEGNPVAMWVRDAGFGCKIQGCFTTRDMYELTENGLVLLESEDELYASL